MVKSSLMQHLSFENHDNCRNPDECRMKKYCVSGSWSRLQRNPSEERRHRGGEAGDPRHPQQVALHHRPGEGEERQPGTPARSQRYEDHGEKTETGCAINFTDKKLNAVRFLRMSLSHLTSRVYLECEL